MMPVAIETSYDIIRDHLEEIKAIEPDLIMYDSTCIWGRDIADLLNIPCIASYAIFVFDSRILKKVANFSMFSMVKMLFSSNVIKQGKSLMQFRRKYKEYVRKYNIDKSKVSELIPNSAPVNIVYTIRELQPFAEILEGDFHFIGPQIMEMEDKSPEYLNNLMPILPTIYISLGTPMNYNLNFFKTYIQAVSELGYNAIIACGQHFSKESFGDVPKNCIIRQFVPQTNILPKCDVFITHGGMSLIMH